MSAADDLVALAASVADGTPVDWRTLERSRLDGRDEGLIEELKAIAALVNIHRTEAATVLDLPDLAREPGARSEPQRRWRHLLLREILGQGSFGVVFRAWDPDLQRDVALKLFRAGVEASRILNEGRLLARIHHPNVVRVHGVDRHQSEVGLWLEFIDGQTLATEIRQSGPLGFREAALVGQDLCRALAAVHAAGILHRDIKPQNVMRERGGRIVLMDFGLGQPQDLERVSDWNTAGTPLLMAPELFFGGPASIQSDIYSLGALVFFIVAGDWPVSATSGAELESAHRSGRRRLLRDVRPDLPLSFIQVVERALAVDPRNRYQTAGAFEAALAGVLGLQSPAGAEPTPTETPAPTSGGRSRATMMGVAGTALAVMLMAAVWMGGLWTNGDVTSSIGTGSDRGTTPDTRPKPPATEVAGLGKPYEIDARFYRVADATPVALASGSRVAPGDRLYLAVHVSTPVHLYVINQDDNGEAWLLFPLPGQDVVNPLQANTTHRIPGRQGEDLLDWQVTSAGGRERFLIVANPEPLPNLERAIARMARPTVGRPVSASAPLSRDTVEEVRGLGGLVPSGAATAATQRLPAAAASLTGAAETVVGSWLRELTLSNPGF